MKILICGVGAIGSNLTSNLAVDLRGKHELTVLDFDMVEERNIRAGTQFYTREQIGQLKVEALEYNIYKFYKRTIFPFQKMVTKQNAKEIIESHDLVIDCFDNHDARLFLQEAWRVASHVQLLHIGFSDQLTFAIEWAKNYQVPSDIKSGRDVCDMPGAGSFAKMVGAAGSLIIQAYIDNNQCIESLGGKYNITKL